VFATVHLADGLRLSSPVHTVAHLTLGNRRQTYDLPFLCYGRLFVPVPEFLAGAAQEFGLSVSPRDITDVAERTTNGTAYANLRHLGERLGLEVDWTGEQVLVKWDGGPTLLPVVARDYDEFPSVPEPDRRPRPELTSAGSDLRPAPEGVTPGGAGDTSSMAYRPAEPEHTVAVAEGSGPADGS
jgi:hypothetical protein